MQPVDIEGPLSHRQKMILEALRKREEGLRLFKQGDQEFRLLTKEKTGHKGKKISSGGKEVTKEVKKLLPKKKVKLVANKSGQRKHRPVAERPRPPETRKKGIQDETIQRLVKEIPELAKNDEYLTIVTIKNKLNTSFYPIKEAIKVLMKDKTMKYVTKPNPKNNIEYQYLVLA